MLEPCPLPALVNAARIGTQQSHRDTRTRTLGHTTFVGTLTTLQLVYGATPQTTTYHGTLLPAPLLMVQILRTGGPDFQGSLGVILTADIISGPLYSFSGAHFWLSGTHFAKIILLINLRTSISDHIGSSFISKLSCKR